jgi:hypothetical protein
MNSGVSTVRKGDKHANMILFIVFDECFCCQETVIDKK